MQNIPSSEEPLIPVSKNQKSLTFQRIATWAQDVAHKGISVAIEKSLVPANRTFARIAAKHTARASCGELQCEFRSARFAPDAHETLPISTSRATLRAADLPYHSVQSRNDFLL